MLHMENFCGAGFISAPQFLKYRETANMIVYVTKETADRYRIGMPEKVPSPLKEISDSVIKRESGDRMLEWGAKLFYFDRRKCLEVANFASKFTLFLVDIKVKDLGQIRALIENYMFDIYEDDPVMTLLLERFFDESPCMIFSKLKDKGNIAHLNHTLWDFADDGYRLYEFIENNILQTRKLNKLFNTKMVVTKMTDGKKEYVFPAQEFERLLKERYSIK